jgi:hypothetical protein
MFGRVSFFWADKARGKQQNSRKQILFIAEFDAGIAGALVL